MKLIWLPTWNPDKFIHYIGNQQETSQGKYQMLLILYVIFKRYWY